MKLPLGKPLTLEEAGQFVKSRKDRGRFNGMVEMKGTVEGGEYKIELLMANGEVVAMEISGISETTLLGDKALREMETLGGSEGDLKLVSFRGEDMDKIKKDNAEALLQKTIMLEDFRIKIKTASEKPQQTEGGGLLNTITSLFSMGTRSGKTEFKGQFRLEAEKLGAVGSDSEVSGVEKKVEEQTTQVSDAKQSLIARIKSRRFGRITETLLSRKRIEKPKAETPLDEKKIETTIDRLFNLLDKRDKLKINESLAKELGVTKERVEEWAVILEEHNLVSINYPAIGEPEITKKKK